MSNKVKWMHSNMVGAPLLTNNWCSLLAMLALVTLAGKTYLEWKQHREFELAQQATLAASGDTLFLARQKPE